MKKILLLGMNGQVGWELQRTLALYGELLCLDRNGTPQYCGNLENPDKISQTITEYRPDVVFNAAAYTAVDKAESDSERARLINAISVESMAKACKQINALLVHFSTDYVFDGSGDEPRLETAQTNPLNIYGKTKLEGENAILTSGCHHLIFRTSWVYGIHGHNFIKTILKLAETKTELSVVEDQWGTPTSAEFIADVSTRLAMQVLHGEKHLCGLYHLVPRGVTNWCEFARWIVKCSNKKESLILDPSKIFGIPSKSYPTPAKRPLNSRLCNQKLLESLGLEELPTWQNQSSRVISCL